MGLNRIRVLIVDDSALVRQVISQALSMDPGIEVIGTASNPYEARDKIVTQKPDVMTLDVEMPRMDGVEFLRRLMPQYPIPVVMVSALTERGGNITLDALDAGAVDYVTKPSANLKEGLSGMMAELRTKIKIASTVDVSRWKDLRPQLSQPYGGRKALAKSTDKVIAIGASTGGTEAIREVLLNLPPSSPGIVIVQHMPPGFTRMFAQRLNQICALLVKEAETGDRVMTGQVLIAPGDKHLTVVRRGGIYEVVCKEGPLMMGHCPSVEVMLSSVAHEVGPNSIGVILTGMGRDGSSGMRAIRDAGGRTIGQDEASCVVYGMPKEAHTLGGVEWELPLQSIAGKIVELVNKMDIQAAKH